MSTQKNNNILIVGVLMIGAFVYMQSKKNSINYAQAMQASGSRPATMPSSAGSGFAQVAVGGIANFLASLVGGDSKKTDEQKYANAIMQSPYLLADHMIPQESVQDILSPANWGNDLEQYLA